MGAFYIGYNYKARKYGVLKIGETGGHTPAMRFGVLRAQETAFEPTAYLLLDNASKAERLYVESYVRMELTKHADLTMIQNDHFTYDIEKGHKQEQIRRYANLAMEYAKQACEFAGVTYTQGTKKYKRG